MLMKKSNTPLWPMIYLTAAIISLTSFVTSAFASTGDADPISLILQFHKYIKTGRGTMAIGVASIFFVWILRNVLGRWVPWFKTRAGGWTMSFLVAGLNYFGSGVLADQSLDLALLLNAVGAAFVSSGGWEGFMDLFRSMKKPELASAASAAILLSVLILHTPGCASVQKVAPAVGPAIVDCTTMNRDKIDALLTEFKPILLEGAIDWKSVYLRAKEAGKAIGGCFLGEMLQASLRVETTTTRSLLPQTPDDLEARAYFELYRKSELDGAQLKTRNGAL